MAKKKPQQQQQQPEEEAPKGNRTSSERFEKNLRVVLTPDQVADRADRAAQLLEDRDHKKEELKAHTKHANGEIDRIEAEMRQFSNEVRTRSTYRDVECTRVYDWGVGRVREIRGDTGEVISDREMTEREKQMGLFDDKKPPEGGGTLDDDFSEDAAQ